MNAAEIIVLIIVVAISVFGFAYPKILKKKKKGGCDGNCHNCPYCK